MQTPLELQSDHSAQTGEGEPFLSNILKRPARESPLLLMAVDFLCRALACLLIVYLAGRSFLARGGLGVLLLGCGVAIWGTSGFITTSILTNSGGRPRKNDRICLIRFMRGDQSLRLDMADRLAAHLDIECTWRKGR